MAKRKISIVHPDDPDLEGRTFGTLYEAQAWAAALCSSYWIEEAET